MQLKLHPFMQWALIPAAFIAMSPVSAVAKPRLAVVSYWGNRTDNFSLIPDHAIALINPNSGILVTNDEARPVDGLDVYDNVLRRARKHDIALYGYVPTGYFHHDCNQAGKCQTWTRVEAQVKTYFARLPGLKGIFFDETAPSDYSCDAFAAEYDKLRTIVARYRPDAKIIFNVGMPDTCAVNAAKPGEMVVLFENDGGHYIQDYAKINAATKLAADKGVQSWHILNNIPPDQLGAVMHAADIYEPDYLYVVDVSGDWQAGFDTYGGLPPYWKAEVKALTGPDDNKN